MSPHKNLLWKALLPTPCPGTHNRGMSPHRGVVNALLRSGKSKIQVLLVDVVVAELCHLVGIKNLDEMKKTDQKTWNGLLSTPNTLDSLEPKQLEKIVGYNQKARPGRSYLSMNLREQLFYGPRNLEGLPLTPLLENSSNNLFPMQEVNEALNTTTISGKKCLKSYENSNRHNLPLKLCVGYLLLTNDWHSNKCSLFWKEKFTTSHRLLYQLSTKTVSIEDGSLFPTPTTQEVEHTKMELTESGRRKNKDGKDSHSVGLMDKIAMLPTPRGMCGTDHTGKVGGAGDLQMTINYGEYNSKSRRSNKEKMLPTPATRDWKGARKPETLAATGRLPSNSLEDTLFAILPTPTTSDGTGHNRTWGTGQVSIHNILEGKGKQPNGEVILSKDAQKTGLKLQPKFVEWMMGYPLSWTDLKDGEV